MLKVTTWKPDTCDCVLHYEWDTDAPPETRVHTPVPTAVIYQQVVDEEATLRKIEEHTRERDREHVKLAAKVGMTLEEFRQFARDNDILLPWDDSWDTVPPVYKHGVAIQKTLGRKLCPAHAHLFDLHAHHGAVVAENQKKNQATGALLEHLNAKLHNKLRTPGADPGEEYTQTDEFSSHLAAFIEFSYDAERRLTLIFRGATAAQLAAARTHLNASGHADVGVSGG